MREILFRGKRIDNDEWVFGSFCMDALEQLNGWCGVDGFIRLYNKAEGKMQMHEVDRQTVGLYTGLKDKNGKRIFEGDVVVYDNSPYNAYCEPQKGEIAWRNGTLCFKFRPWNSVMYRALCSDDFFAAKCEVIGNIHDNPEMLEDVGNE